MTTRTWPRTLAALTAALALPLSGLAVTPAAAADTVAIPQAPVLSVIAKTETLPFTLDGGGDIEVAVLTDGQNIGDANWTVTDELALAPYNGQTIRVLARKAGITDPADYFDASYTVRDTYPPAPDQATAENPTGAIRASDARFRAWADGYQNYRVGTGVHEQWRKRVDELGFLGIEPASDDTVNGATEGLVVLGNGGEITLTFSAGIQDGAGDDFAVFENGFRINGTVLDFAEFGYIEVSSDGHEFARFDSATTNPDRVGQYAGLPASAYGGLAGQYWTGWGTGFDLAALKNNPKVRSGAVDLSHITHVRVLDIPGCGEELDSWGRQIFDPCGTVGSGGFDLTAIGVLNPVRDTVWIDPVVLKDVTMTSANVVTKFKSQGKGNAALRLELADDITGANARTVATANAFAWQNGTTFTMAAKDLTKSTPYAVRIVARQAADGVEVATPWRAFSTKSVTLTAPTVQAAYGAVVWPDEQTAQATVGSTVNTGGGNDQEVYFEYSATAEHSDIQRTPSTFVDGGSSANKGMVVTIAGLEQRYDYWVRSVAIDVGDATRAESEWTKFNTYYPGQMGPLNPVVTRVNGKATMVIKSYAFPGSNQQFRVAAQYTTDATQQDFQTVDCGEGTPSGSSLTYSCTITGLELNSSYWTRLVATGINETLVNNGGWQQVSTVVPAKLALATAVRVGNTWQVQADVDPGSRFGPMALALEVRNAATNELVTTLNRTLSGDDGPSQEFFTIGSLDADTAYKATAILSAGDTELTRSSLSGTRATPLLTQLTPVNRYSSRDGVIGETSKDVTVRVAGSSPQYDLTIEVSEHEDGSSPRRISYHNTAVGTFTYTVADLVPGKTYWLRSVAKATHPLANQETATSEWAKVVITQPTITLVDYQRVNGTAMIVADVYTGAAATDLTVTWKIDQGTTMTRTITGNGDTQRVMLSQQGLPQQQATNMSLQVSLDDTLLALYSSGAAGEGAPVVIKPDITSVNGPSVTVQTVIQRGSYGPFTARTEIAESPEAGAFRTVIPVVAPGRYDNQFDATAQFSGLEPGHTYWVRTVITSTSPLANKLQTASEWVQFRTQDLNQLFGEAEVTGITRTAATLTVPARAGMYDRSVVAEVEPAAGGERVSTEPRTIAKRESGPASFTLADLKPNTAYQARLVSSVPGADDQVTDWLEFRTAAQPATLTQPAVTALAKDAATITTALTPGDLDQQVWLEYTDGDHADAAATAAKPVKAGGDPVPVVFELANLSPNTRFSYRVVAEASDGAKVNSSWASFTTAKISDPTVSVTISPATPRVGKTVTVTWKTTDATAVTATGSWTGTKALSGTEKIKITKAGTWTFGITATGEAGNTTKATATVNATLPAKKLTLTSQKPVTAAGKKLTVKATGLTAGEPYTITISGIKVRTGKASKTGVVSASVTVPKALGSGSHTITVTGATTDRTGTATAKLVAATKKLTVKATSKVKRGKKITVKTSGLGAYEPVTIKLGSTKVTKTATSKGTISVKVTVPKKTKVGKTKVTITGITAGRTGSKTIKVTT